MSIKKGIEKYATDAFFSRKASNMSYSSNESASKKPKSNKRKKRASKLNNSHRANVPRKIETVGHPTPVPNDFINQVLD